jgi:hypothetical protein
MNEKKIVYINNPDSKISNFDIPRINDVWILKYTYLYNYIFKRPDGQRIGENNLAMYIYQMKRGPNYDYDNQFDYFAVTIIHQMIPGWATTSNDVNVQMKDKTIVNAWDSQLELGKYGPEASSGEAGESAQFSIEGSIGAQGKDLTGSIGLGFSIGSSYSIEEVAVEDHSSFGTDTFNIFHNFKNGAGNAARATKNVYPAFILRTPQRDPGQVCTINPYVGYYCYTNYPKIHFTYSIEATFGHQYMWFWLYDTTSINLDINFSYSPS